MTMVVEKDIAILDNFLTEEQCDDIIRIFEEDKKWGKTATRAREDLHERQDDQLVVGTTEFLSISNPSLRAVVKNLWEEAIPQYLYKYPVLKPDSFDLYCNGYLIQKTKTKEGYHLWHYENSGVGSSNRLVTWCVYLNDDFTGGETEFLYQSFRTKPKKGTLVMFPAHYTHTHRGNPPLEGSKYFITSWLNIQYKP